MSSSPSVPAAPDPAATAAAQGTANVSSAAAQAALNNMNQFTPYGATTYQPTGSYTTPSGQVVPTYSQYTELSPMAQSLLTGQMGLQSGQQGIQSGLQGLISSQLLPAAGGLAGQVGTAANNPLNFNTPFSSTLNTGPQQLNQQAANAIYNQQASFLNPQWQQQQQQLQDQLSQQGIPVGSQAYNNAMTQLENARTQAYQAASNQAIAGGSAAASNLFNMALAGQQQNVGQQQLAQQQPISLLGSLFGLASGVPISGTPSQPIATPSASTVSPTDVIGATAMSQQAQMAAYQAQLAQQNAMFGGLASLGGAGLMAGLMPGGFLMGIP